MTDIPQLINEALSLPLDDRIRLAQVLWASLQSPTNTSVSDEAAQALDVAERRDAELESRSVEGTSHAAALKKARNSLRCE